MFSTRPSLSWRYGTLAVFALLLVLWSLSSPRTAPHRGQIATWVNDELSEHLNIPASNPDRPAEPLSLQAPITYSHSRFDGEGLVDFKKPEGLRVVAMVLAGRREFVSILECYMRVSCPCLHGDLD